MAAANEVGEAVGGDSESVSAEASHSGSSTRPSTSYGELLYRSNTSLGPSPSQQTVGMEKVAGGWDTSPRFPHPPGHKPAAMGGEGSLPVLPPCSPRHRRAVNVYGLSPRLVRPGGGGFTTTSGSGGGSGRAGGPARFAQQRAEARIREVDRALAQHHPDADVWQVKLGSLKSASAVGGHSSGSGSGAVTAR